MTYRLCDRGTELAPAESLSSLGLVFEPNTLLVGGARLEQGWQIVDVALREPLEPRKGRACLLEEVNGPGSVRPVSHSNEETA